MSPSVLVPFDDSDPAHLALEHALEEFPDAEVVLLAIADHASVAPVPDVGAGTAATEQLTAAIRDRLEAAQEVAADGGPRFRMEVRGGAPANEIIEFVEREAVDHVVVGSHGRSGVSRLLHGSVAETVVRHSPVPVTVVTDEK